METDHVSVNQSEKTVVSVKEEDQQATSSPLLEIEISEIATQVNVEAERVIDVQDVNFYYGAKQALFRVSVPIHRNHVTAFIGPSGCGKSTFLRTLNRMNEFVEGTRIEGNAWFGGQNIYAPTVDVISLRQRIGMVFQRPNPFSSSIFENVAYGLRVLKFPRHAIHERVEESLRGAALWDEVKDRLHKSALGLSGGQQQRLCIARAVAPRPEVILMDEPCSALDPLATLRVEELINKLREEYTIVLVTHNMQQAARVSQYTGFFLQGKLVEWGLTVDVFTHPKQKETEDYISGRFG